MSRIVGAVLAIALFALAAFGSWHYAIEARVAKERAEQLEKDLAAQRQALAAQEKRNQQVNKERDAAIERYRAAESRLRQQAQELGRLGNPDRPGDVAGHSLDGHLRLLLDAALHGCDADRPAKGPDQPALGVQELVDHAISTFCTASEIREQLIRAQRAAQQIAEEHNRRIEAQR